jgi:hypothetical protein
VSVARLGVGAHEQQNEPTGGAGNYDRHVSFLLNSVAGSASGGGSAASHPLGNFEDEPAETGEAQTPKNHDRDHRLDPYFSQDDYEFTAR